MGGKRRLIHKTELKKMRDQGKTIAECAEHFGCSDRTINKRLKKFGLLTQPEYHFDREMLRKLYVDAGLTCVEIASLYDCHPDTILNRINGMGIERRQARRDGEYIGTRSPVWKGGIDIQDGYIRVRQPRGSINLHRLVAEYVLGRELADDECVHHMDMNRANNDPGNLIVCEDLSEHMKLHAAMRRDPDLDQRAWIEEYRMQQERNQAA